MLAAKKSSCLQKGVTFELNPYQTPENSKIAERYTQELVTQARVHLSRSSLPQNPGQRQKDMKNVSVLTCSQTARTAKKTSNRSAKLTCLSKELPKLASAALLFFAKPLQKKKKEQEL